MQHSQNVKQQIVAVDFSLNEIDRIVAELTNEFSKTGVEAKDEDILRMKDILPDRMSRIGQLSAKFQKVLEIMPLEYPNRITVVKRISTDYERLILQRDIYEQFILQQISERELSKEKKFKTSFLNIKLKECCDYSSVLDI